MPAKLSRPELTVDDSQLNMIRDPHRLAVLQRIGLDGGAEVEAFDRLTRLAADLLNVPVALVSIVGEDRQFLYSGRGLPQPWDSVRELPLSHSFCSVVIASGESLRIADLRAHEEHANSAIAELGAVAYAAVPLCTAQGQVLGVLCLMDTKPHEWSDDEVRVLRDLGAWAVTEIELRTESAELRRVEQEREELLAREREERARSEAAEAHYRRLVETSPLGIFVVDLDGRIVETNPAGERIVQRERTELVGTSFVERVVPDDRGAVSTAFRQLTEEEVDSVEIDAHINLPSPDVRLLSLTATTIREAGRITGTLCLGRDITDERAKDDQVQLLATALEKLGEGVTIINEDGRVLYFNAAAAQILGCADGVEPTFLTEDLLPDDESRTQLAEIYDTLADAGPWNGRVRRRRVDDGRVISLDTFIGALDSSDGSRHYFAIFHDAEATIQQEQNLRRVERLASVGTLLSGVAHELNNPLHTIQGYAELMLLADRSEEDRDDLETIQREAERMARIVADLKQVASQTQEDEANKAPVDLNEVVRHVLKVRRYSLETSNIMVREDLAADLPDVYADRGQIEQVVINLVVNAEQAMAESPERRLIMRTRRIPGGASLQVVDSGPGIPARHLERIFDPFFTTKPPGEGTGLGLSLVHSIVEEHGGEIRVDSEVGSGTAFRVGLPRAEKKRSATAAVAEEGTSASLHVLVVDDEAAIRRALARYLGDLGHAVKMAAEGREALALLDEHDFDVILSDLKMPGLGGEALLQSLRARGLEDRVIFLTGQVTGGGGVISGCAEVPVLLKPVKLNEVARAVRARASTSH